MTTIDLIRHGEPVGGRRYRGMTDDPLSSAGWRQMDAAVGDECPWHRILTSPLRRCREFAVALGERHSIPVIEDARLSEQGFGAWEGRTPEELRRQDPEQLRRFYADPVGYRPDGAEPLDAFLQRVGASWEEMLGHYSDEHILVIGHAGTMRAIIGHVLGVQPRSVFRIAVGYAAIARIESDGERLPTLVLGRSG